MIGAYEGLRSVRDEMQAERDRLDADIQALNRVINSYEPRGNPAPDQAPAPAPAPAPVPDPDPTGKKKHARGFKQGHEKAILLCLYTGAATNADLCAAIPQCSAAQIRASIRRLAINHRVIEYQGKWKLTADGLDRARLFLANPGVSVLRPRHNRKQN